MNSEYDITLHSDETTSPGTARDRFLDSLGLGVTASTELTADEIDDDGVVLSSQPDDLELVAETAPLRNASVSLGASAERTRTVAISIPARDRTPASQDQPVASIPAIPDKPANLDENLSLECPECHGELVLQRRHIGIEGLCVWCHTPIIAAESARDSVVRIFPVLGRITKPFSAVAPVAEEMPRQDTQRNVPAPVSEEPPAAEPIAPPVEATEAVIPEQAAVIESTPVEEAPAEFSPEAFGFGPFPGSTPSPAAAVPVKVEIKEEISAFDLDALYATTGFGTPADEPSNSIHGFGETISTTSALETANAEPAPMTGFGAFLQAGVKEETAPASAPASVSWSIPANPEPAAPQETFAFSAATPWGPPAKLPAATETPAANDPISKDEAPVSLPSDFAVGFGSPAPAPTKEPLFEAVSESGAETGFAAAPWENAFEDPIQAPAATPALMPASHTPAAEFGAAFPMSGFGSPAGQSDLGSFSAPGQEISPVVETVKPPVDDFAAAFASAGSGAPASPATAPGFASFMNAAGSEPAPATELVESPDFTFQSSPAAKLALGSDVMEEKRSFAMPGNSFSTGSSEGSDTSSFSSFLAAPSKAETGSTWGISEPLGLSSPDDAPVALSDVPPGESFPATGSVTPFEDSPFSDFATAAVQSAAGTPISLFQEAAPLTSLPAIPAPAAGTEPSAPAPVSVPPLPHPQEPTFSSITNPIEAAPNVVSEPLGSRQKPTVRKGFIVLMVVIVGFAAGAAIASFVLPVDEYVQAARALMEKKFNPSSALQQIPVLPLPAGEDVATAITAQP